MNNNLSLLLSLALITLLQACGSKPQDPISLTPDWNVGDSMQFEVSIIQARYNGYNLLAADTQTYSYEARILEKAVDHYLIQWDDNKSLPKKMLENSGKKMEELISEAEEFFKLIPEDMLPVYRTDLNGTFQGLENFDTLQSIFTKLIDHTLKNFEKEYNLSAEDQKRIDPIYSIMSSRVGLEEFILKDALLIHKALGKTYTLGDTIFDTHTSAGDTWGIALRPDSKIYLKRLEPEKKEMLIQEDYITPGKQIKEAYENFLVKTGIEDSLANAMVEQADIDFNGSVQSLFKYESATPLKISMYKELKVKGPMGESSLVVSQTIRNKNP
ncbi:MAG: hypothetical protein MRZ79_23050 [Bacteroidia bacterium]|nr:hypothetical protein [Bacteroidia bacterium]